jgi:hypothetical protein
LPSSLTKGRKNLLRRFSDKKGKGFCFRQGVLQFSQEYVCLTICKVYVKNGPNLFLSKVEETLEKAWQDSRQIACIKQQGQETAVLLGGANKKWQLSRKMVDPLKLKNCFRDL